MKPQEIRDLSLEDLKQRIISTEEELFNLKVQLNSKQLENPMKIREARRSVARLRTILREKESVKKEG